MDVSVIRNFKLHCRCLLASRPLQAAESDDRGFKWSLLDCLFAVKSAWPLVTPTTIINSYRNAGFVYGDAEVSSKTESSSPLVQGRIKQWANWAVAPGSTLFSTINY